MTVYEFDRDSAPDGDFVAGSLERLVVGNRGRLLDARRTPVQVTAVSPDTGAFEIEILRFEDAGARWELGLEEVTRFQFERDAALATAEEIRELDLASRRFRVEVVIEAEPAAGAQTAEAIASEQRVLRAELAGVEALHRLDLATHVRTREGHPELMVTVDRLAGTRGVAELDERLASAFVSNPQSGEVVKGHAVVLAELGLCRYQGPRIRDPGVLQTWTAETRARHIIFRLALMRELFGTVTPGMLWLFRAAAHEGPPPSPAPRSFISATLSREVAEDHFAGGPRSTSAVMWRQRTPAERLFMTFLETPALNRQFKEAEAILIAGSEGMLF